jgi:hypothetical protein
MEVLALNLRIGLYMAMLIGVGLWCYGSMILHGGVLIAKLLYRGFKAMLSRPQPKET